MDRTASRTVSAARRVVAAACAVALVLSVVTAPVCALAAPTGTVDQRMAAKRAQAALAEGQLRVLRTELSNQYAELDRANADLDAARYELAQTAARIEALDADIVTGRHRLDARAIALYKSDSLDMVEVLLTTSSIRDFFERIDFIVLIQESDSRLLTDLNTAKAESAALREQQTRRESELAALRQATEARGEQVEASLKKQEAIMASLATDIAVLVREQEEAAAAAAAAAAEAASRDGGSEPPGGFDPTLVISDAKFMASGSMSAAEIQAFLDGQAGSLRTYRGPDHGGVTKTAAQMIAEACVAHGVSPKVVMATLQKEQSLISRPNPSQYALDWAMGCGKMEGSTIESMKGFGNQIWDGARVLMKNRAGWRSGRSLPIDGTALYAKNASTYSLYRYTPHFSGGSSFWRLYWRYFGDPS